LKQIDLINHAWDALLDISEADKVSYQLGKTQRRLFSNICENGNSCFTATKWLLEVVSLHGNSKATFG
jgi:hypothetical protein